MFATIGLVVCLLLSIKAIYYLYKCLTRRPFIWISKNQWAVVTGATDGIGYEFARQLAHKGYNLMLLSRSEPKLQLTKQKIYDDLLEGGVKKKEIQIRTLAVDFTRLDIYEQVRHFLNVEQNQIFVLVNNVGASYKNPDYFIGSLYKSDPLVNQQIINVNVIGTTRMTELILGSMVEVGRGLLVNVSSMASVHYNPLLSTYSATKSYMTTLSDCLAVEYKAKGITVVTLTPCFVTSNMAPIKSSIIIPSASRYVKSVLAKIKYTDSFSTQGYWSHWAMNAYCSSLSWLFSPQFLAECTLPIFEKSSANLLNAKNTNKQLNLWNLFS